MNTTVVSTKYDLLNLKGIFVIISPDHSKLNVKTNGTIKKSGFGFPKAEIFSSGFPQFRKMKADKLVSKLIFLRPAVIMVTFHESPVAHRLLNIYNFHFSFGITQFLN